MTNITSAVEVTQADREALERFIREDAPIGMKMMFGGDPAWKLAQTFARHRLAALEEAAKVAEEHKATGYMSDRERGYCHDHGDEIATSIRALAKGGAS